jgi:hypothetical protein
MYKSHKVSLLLGSAAVLFMTCSNVNSSDKAAAPAVVPASAAAMAGKSEQMIKQAADLKFNPAPGLPAGAKMAVVRGDPSKAGHYTLRLELPDCYVIPSHWHTNDEQVTVLSGTLNVGFGDSIDKTKSAALIAGGFQLVPGKANHYVWAKGLTLFQVDGEGPRDTTFIHPEELALLFKSNNTCP